jgi:hypothetical protein
MQLLSMTKLEAQAIVDELSAKADRTPEEHAQLAFAINFLANNWR